MGTMIKNFFLLLSFCYMFIVYTGVANADGRPNILWIVTDDQRPDSLQAFNRAVTGESNSPLGPVLSPNIDQLAAAGVLFSSAYCNSPACAPSRASMHTGQYAFRNGINGFEQAHDQIDVHTTPFPQVLSNEGYYTVVFGKLGTRINQWGPGQTWEGIGIYNWELGMGDLQNLGMTDRNTYYQWQGGERTAMVERWYFADGTEERFVLDMDDFSTVIEPEGSTRRQELLEQLDIVFRQPGTATILGGVSPQCAEQALDGQIASEFVKYLDNRGQMYTSALGSRLGAPMDAPLFVHLSFNFPHTPVLPPAEFRYLFVADDYTVPEFSRAELERLPAQLRRLYDRMHVDHHSYEVLQQLIRDYYAFCAYGDYLIGRSIQAFKEYSEAKGEEYLIIYVCGDHSWHLGEHGIMSKFGPYEQSNRQAVVVAASDPGVFVPGSVYDGFIEYVDFAPTILKAAGVDISGPEFDHLDGYPLQSILDGSLPKREYVLGNMNHVYGPRAYIRNEDFVFSMRTRPVTGHPGGSYRPGQNMRWGMDAPLEDVEMALFDLRIDPSERHNVAYDEQYLGLASFLRDKLAPIVLGDRALEVDWSKRNDWYLSTFAEGADDKKLSIPPQLIPQYPIVDGKYSTDSFQLLGPVQETALNPNELELRWQMAGGAAAYRLQISEQPDMSDPVLDKSLVATEYRPLGLNYGQTYYWQVQAIPELLYVFGAESSYNQHLAMRPNIGGAHEFTTAASAALPQVPVLTEVKNVFGENVLLRWEPVPYVNRYSVYRRTNETDWQLLVHGLDRQTTAYVDDQVITGVGYAYRLTAANDRGRSAYSAVAEIQVDGPTILVEERFSDQKLTYDWQTRGRVSFRHEDGEDIGNLRALFPQAAASLALADFGGEMYRVNVAFQIKEWGNQAFSALRLRTSVADRNEYQLLYRHNDRSLELRERTATGSTVLAAASLELALDTWYELRFDVASAGIRLVINEETIFVWGGKPKFGRGDMDLLVNNMDMDIAAIVVLE